MDIVLLWLSLSSESHDIRPVQDYYYCVDRSTSASNKYINVSNPDGVMSLLQMGRIFNVTKVQD